MSNTTKSLLCKKWQAPLFFNKKVLHNVWRCQHHKSNKKTGRRITHCGAMTDILIKKVTRTTKMRRPSSVGTFPWQQLWSSVQWNIITAQGALMHYGFFGAPRRQKTYFISISVTAFHKQKQSNCMKVSWSWERMDGRSFRMPPSIHHQGEYTTGVMNDAKHNMVLQWSPWQSFRKRFPIMRNKVNKARILILLSKFPENLHHFFQSHGMLPNTIV